MNKNIYKIGKELFITNNEEIKIGDWVIEYIFDNLIFKAYSATSEFIKKSKFHSLSRNHCKKIILTTDPDLIKDGVQAIDDEFLEWFVNNSGCEKVEIFHQDVYSMDKWDRRYSIIIPKEETKQETIDSIALEAYPKDIRTHRSMHQEEVFDNNEFLRNAFIEGAKWQEERMYSEEEVLELIKKGYYSHYNSLPIEKWFEQFKKK